MNPVLKYFAESLLTVSGFERLARRRVRDRTLILAYHDIVPHGDRRSGEHTLHLAQREFAQQLDHLERVCDVVPLDDLSAKPRTKGRPRVVITFDDAYAGALTAGVDELTRRGMPATIFVSPALLGGPTWWDLLGDQYDGQIPGDVRQRALHELKGDAKAVLDGAGVIRRTTGRSGARIGTESELIRAANRPGISIGSHSWSHQNLCRLDRAALEMELARPLDWLRGKFPRTVQWLSYPYGLFNETVERVAKAVGYTGGLKIDGGWLNDHPGAPFATPRFNVPAGLSTRGFRLRVAGL